VDGPAPALAGSGLAALAAIRPERDARRLGLAGRDSEAASRASASA
jgi:hypothetical protein